MGGGTENKAINKGLISKCAKTSSSSIFKKKKNPIKRWTEYLNRHSYKEDIQMDKNQMKRCSTSLTIQFSRSGVFDSFATPWIAASHASLSITNSQSSPRLTFIESVMPSSHLILCHPLLLLPPIPPNIRVFSNESTLCMRWPKYWSFSFSIIPSKEIPGLISLQSKGLSRVFSNTTV